MGEFFFGVVPLAWRIAPLLAYVALALTLPFLIVVSYRRCPVYPSFLCQWGDLTPSGACRLIQEEKSAASAASGVPLHQ